MSYLHLFIGLSNPNKNWRVAKKKLGIVLKRGNSIEFLFLEIFTKSRRKKKDTIL